MSNLATGIDVLCVGASSFDIAFQLVAHPGADEKCVASAVMQSGGGPAANAAVTVCRLGHSAAFCGYVGNDHYGEHILSELSQCSVFTGFVYRAEASTPISAIMVKPDGARTVVHHRQKREQLTLSMIPQPPAAKILLFDGHEGTLSLQLHRQATLGRIATILDAGSLHQGTRDLAGIVDYLVASERFALDYTGEREASCALKKLRGVAPFVVITLGERGAVWARGGEFGSIEAFKVAAVDTTGAGDAFHGAFAVGILERMEWLKLLRFASAVAALTCCKLGARAGIPLREEVEKYLKSIS